MWTESYKLKIPQVVKADQETLGKFIETPYKLWHHNHRLQKNPETEALMKNIIH